MKVTISFGAMAPTLREQLQGYKITPKDLKFLQLDKDALVRLHIRGILSDSMANTARRKLMKKTLKSIKGVDPTKLARPA